MTRWVEAKVKQRMQRARGQAVARVLAWTSGGRVVLAWTGGHCVDGWALRGRVGTEGGARVVCGGGQAGDVAKLEQFVKRTQPDVMVVGAKDVRCRTLKEQLDNLVNHCQTRKHLHRQIDVLYADEVPHTPPPAPHSPKPRCPACRLRAPVCGPAPARACVRSW